jgi:hypothetical protein
MGPSAVRAMTDVSASRPDEAQRESGSGRAKAIQVNECISPALRTHMDKACPGFCRWLQPAMRRDLEVAPPAERMTKARSQTTLSIISYVNLK